MIILISLLAIATVLAAAVYSVRTLGELHTSPMPEAALPARLARDTVLLLNAAA